MSDVHIYPVKPEIAAHAHINAETYRALYEQSIAAPDVFWAEQAERFLTWDQRWSQVMDYDFEAARIRWFDGGKLNVSVNCLDRHLDHRGDQVAIIWEGDNPEHDQKITYRELYEQVCRFANELKNQGVKKGDRVCIYLPMIAEAAAAMLACARIGAVHSVVFGGFSAEALKDRILDCGCRYVVCADEGYRGGRIVPIKATVDAAAVNCPDLGK
ncbi:MAG: AMP-binding protein, partial [Gammaproteobacteria bacterium]